MKKAVALALGVFALLSCSNPVTQNKESIGNPYLPLWEHTPDGEPKIFEDPANPGQYRVYVYYSHDTKGISYCGVDTRCWSAPVDDLASWRDEGAIFSYRAEGVWDSQFAPDITELVRKDGSKEYYLFPNDQGRTRKGLVLKGTSPMGPFTPINLEDDGINQKEGSVADFDPGVIVEYVTDKNDPDYEIGFRAYTYGGIIRSMAAQLDQNTMYSVRPGTSVAVNYNPSCLLNTGYEGTSFLSMMSKRLGMSGKEPKISDYPLLYQDQDPKDFSFFEASSIRKVGNKYVLIWSSYSGPDYGLSLYNSNLRYAYGDTPFGPWKAGGILVDSRGPVPTKDGSTLMGSFFGDNTHGSIAQIGDQWYVFYHRAPGARNINSRQAMVAPINVEWDEKPVSEGGKVSITGFDSNAADHKWSVQAADGNKYEGAELTSEGFYIYGLPPYRYYSAGYACMVSNDNSLEISYDNWDNSMIATGISDGDVLGYKYFAFQGMPSDAKGLHAFEGIVKGDHAMFNLFLTPKTDKAFKINVMMDGPWANPTWKGSKIAEICVPAGSPQEVTEFKADVASAVEGLSGKHAIYLVAECADEGSEAGVGSDGLCEIIGLGFSSPAHPLVRTVPPTIQICAGNSQLDIPENPVLCTNDNGIVDLNSYDIHCTLPDDMSKAPRIKASSSDKRVKISIEQAESLKDTAVVKCVFNDAVKYYKIHF